MRRIAGLLSLTAFLAIAPLAAQGSLELLGGLTSTKVDVTDQDISYNTKSRSGFAVGLSIGTASGNAFALTPQVFYVTKGGSLSSSGFTQKIKTDYVEVPILFTKGFATSSSLTPYVFVGPTASYQLSCKASGIGDFSSPETDCSDMTEDSKDPFKKFDVGVTGGIGVRAGKVSLSGRYGSSVINLNDIADSDAKIKNNGFLFLVGLSF